MTDYTLKFKDEAAANKALNGYEGSIDTIGVIYKDDKAILGWHVNVRGPESPTLAAYHVEVLTPERVWV